MKKRNFWIYSNRSKKTSDKPLDITDVKKKYHLRVIQKRNTLFGKVFGSTSLVMGVFIFIVSVIMIRKCWQSSSRKRNNEGLSSFHKFDKRPAPPRQPRVYLRTRAPPSEQSTQSQLTEEGTSFTITTSIPDDDES